MLVVGDREAAEGTVSVRSRRGGDLGAKPVEEFAGTAEAEVAARAS
jgi:threonyl-tRNA synthetase